MPGDARFDCSTDVGELVGGAGRGGAAGVTTVTSTVPLPGGLVAVISVPELPVITALTSPKSTAVASVKPLPVMVTLSPPAAVPVTGEIAVTCGRAEAGGVVLDSTGPGIPGPGQ